MIVALAVVTVLLIASVLVNAMLVRRLIGMEGYVAAPWMVRVDNLLDRLMARDFEQYKRAHERIEKAKQAHTERVARIERDQPVEELVEEPVEVPQQIGVNADF